MKVKRGPNFLDDLYKSIFKCKAFFHKHNAQRKNWAKCFLHSHDNSATEIFYQILLPSEKALKGTTETIKLKF